MSEQKNLLKKIDEMALTEALNKSSKEQLIEINKELENLINKYELNTDISYDKNVTDTGDINGS